MASRNRPAPMDGAGSAWSSLLAGRSRRSSRFPTHRGPSGRWMSPSPTRSVTSGCWRSMRPLAATTRSSPRPSKPPGASSNGRPDHSSSPATSNAPRWEGEDAQGRPVLVTFGQRRLRSGGFGPRGHRQDLAERLVLDRSSLGLVDAYRAIHGYGVVASSWSTVRSGRRWNYRLDHVLARGGLTPVKADYRQEFRGSADGLPRLSDHAAIEATLKMSDEGTR